MKISYVLSWKPRKKSILEKKKYHSKSLKSITSFRNKSLVTMARTVLRSEEYRNLTAEDKW